MSWYLRFSLMFDYCFILFILFFETILNFIFGYFSALTLFREVFYPNRMFVFMGLTIKWK